MIIRLKRNSKSNWIKIKCVDFYNYNRQFDDDSFELESLLI